MSSTILFLIFLSLTFARDGDLGERCATNSAVPGFKF